MKIGVISDIHTDMSPANRQIVELIADEARCADLDVLVICGDVSPDMVTLSKTLWAFRDIGKKTKKLFVSGNHDIWLIRLRKPVTSHDKYQLITTICRESGFHHLGDSPVIVGKVGFCGTIGWYDYSFKRNKYLIPEKVYMRKSLGGSVWNDVNYARWGKSDPEVAREFERDIQEQIDSIKDQVYRIITVTHHVPFQECVAYKDTLPWDFFSAFMGSAGLGNICLNEPLVTHAFFGHTHFDFFTKIGNVWAICSPVGYLTEPPEDLHQYAHEKLKIIELPDREER
jgi:putative phosphoesterase